MNSQTLFKREAVDREGTRLATRTKTDPAARMKRIYFPSMPFRLSSANPARIHASHSAPSKTLR
jgi:hypothetical protein